MTDDIVWEEPPAPREGAPWSSPARTAAVLRSNPGRWARIATKSTPGAATTAARHITYGEVSFWRPAGAFEATSRTVWSRSADGARTPEHRVYARFVETE